MLCPNCIRASVWPHTELTNLILAELSFPWKRAVSEFVAVVCGWCEDTAERHSKCVSRWDLSTAESADVGVVFSTNSVDDILLLLTFICSLVSSVHNVSDDELEELKVCLIISELTIIVKSPRILYVSSTMSAHYTRVFAIVFSVVWCLCLCMSVHVCLYQHNKLIKTVTSNNFGPQRSRIKVTVSSGAAWSQMQYLLANKTEHFWPEGYQ